MIKDALSNSDQLEILESRMTPVP